MTDAGREARRPLVVVLGASGLIGTAVAAALTRRNDIRVRVVGRRSCVIPAGRTAAVDHVSTDLTRAGQVQASVEGADAVIHLVGYSSPTSRWRVRPDNQQAYRTNVTLVDEVIGALLRGTRSGHPPQLILAGAVAPDLATEDTYLQHKVAAEKLVLDVTRTGAVRGMSLRLPTVYGHTPGTPVLDQGVVAAMVRSALAGRELTLWDGGWMRRDLLHVDDAAAAFVSAHQYGSDLAGRHWSVGSGDARTMTDICESIAAVCERATGHPGVPLVSVPVPAHASAADLQHVQVDAKPFTDLTGWRPTMALDTGLSALAAALMQSAAEPLTEHASEAPEGARHT